jgi:hypothetical protein
VQRPQQRRQASASYSTSTLTVSSFRAVWLRARISRASHRWFVTLRRVGAPRALRRSPARATRPGRKA